MIDGLLEIARARVDKCLESKATLCNSELAGARADDCDALILGSFLRGLQKLEILPRCQSPNIQKTVSQLLVDLLGIEIKAVHQQCKYVPGTTAIHAGYSKCPNPTLDCHLRHKEVQKAGGTMD